MTYSVLLASAATLGFFHTAIGIDHSMPFVVLARTRGWSLSRTLLITSACGLAHVLSSVLIASVGLSLGVAGSKLSFVEQTRGSLAAWLLVGFGLAYAAVPLWKKRARRFMDSREGISDHSHFGADRADLVAMPVRRLMPALLIIFALGPCEALLPLLMAGGISLSIVESAVVALVFSAATVGTMLALVAAGYEGAARLKVPWLDRIETHTHTLSGLTLAMSGAAIALLGI
jgi:sulfite exporter TauE/SafE